MTLVDLGWGEPFQSAFAARGIADEVPARVVEEHRGVYTVIAESGEYRTEISGRLRYQAKRRIDFPAVGDWVAVDAPIPGGTARLQTVLSRRTKLSRKASGQETEEQLIAANLDTVFIVTSLNRDFNARRMERYLAMVVESGIAPVVLLSKADLCADPAAAIAELSKSAAGAPVHAVSSTAGIGLEALAPYLKTGKTVALIGSSGVGKSTLINRLVGEPVQKVQAVRENDDRGRHTTTGRRLIALPQGGLLIDTPGMRELQLWDTQGVAETFDDITTLIAQCRFNDCRHHTDAGCAVQAAIQDGVLAQTRYDHFLKLRQEANDLAILRDTEAANKANEKIKKARAEQKRERKNDLSGAS